MKTRVHEAGGLIQNSALEIRGRIEGDLPEKDAFIERRQQKTYVVLEDGAIEIRKLFKSGWGEYCRLTENGW